MNCDVRVAVHVVGILNSLLSNQILIDFIQIITVYFVTFSMPPIVTTFSKTLYVFFKHPVKET